MIEAQGLAKRYGEIRAVRDVTFSASRGEIVGFLGPNGAGKTTTLRMLTTYLAPSAGTAKVAGYDILKESDQVRRVIGYLPENPPCYGEMRVTEFVKFMAELRQFDRKRCRSRVDEVLEMCGLTKVRSRLCGQLSKGYRQRVGLAHAIVHEPQVVILDEPTSGLDPAQIVEIRKLIAELGEGRTVILSTHILQEVTQICNRVVIVVDGAVRLNSAIGDLSKEKSIEQIFMECVSGAA